MGTIFKNIIKSLLSDLVGSDVKNISGNFDIPKFEFDLGDEETESSAEKIKKHKFQSSNINYKKLHYEISKESSFFKTGKMLAEYSDETDLESYTPFFTYYTQYYHMSVPQLKSYIVWRTKVRKGIVDQIDTSYVFVYIYELLHLIGSKDEYDGFEKLLYIWEKVRNFEPKIDRYLNKWIPDFIEYFGLNSEDCQNTFYLEMMENGIISTPQNDAQILLDAIEDGNIAIVNDVIAKHGYNFKRGAFSKKDKTQTLDVIVDHLTSEMLEKQNDMMKNLTYMSREYNHPFSGAVFELHVHDFDGVVMPMIKKDFLEEYAREIEVKLDAQFGVTQRLKKRTRRYLKRPQLNFMRDTIKSYVLENNLTIDLPSVEKSKSKKISESIRMEIPRNIEINIESLKMIRENADKTAEKLVPVDSYVDLIDEIEVEAETIEKSIEYDDVWEEFKRNLSEQSLMILSLIANERRYDDIANYALSSFLMLEEELEKINETALEIVGDTIIESDMNSVSIFEDYKNEILVALNKETREELN